MCFPRNKICDAVFPSKSGLVCAVVVALPKTKTTVLLKKVWISYSFQIFRSRLIIDLTASIAFIFLTAAPPENIVSRFYLFTFYFSRINHTLTIIPNNTELKGTQHI